MILHTLTENVRLLSAAGPWFVAAIAIDVIANIWDFLALPGLLTSPVDSLSFAFVATGVSTPVLHFSLLAALESLRNCNAAILLTS